nr:PAS domain-containing sensor histidine kinase [Granulicella sp. dw_53]
MDRMHDCVIFTDLDGVITGCNRVVSTVYGYTPEELEWQNVAILYPPEDREFLTETLIPAVMKTGGFSGELRHQRKLGNYIYIHLSVSLLQHEDGTPYGMVGFAVDVTPQKLSGIQSDGRFEVLTQALPALIWWADPNGDMNYATSRTLEYFGVPLEQISGRRWIEFVHPEDREHSLAVWERAIAERGIFETEYRLRRHDGEYIYHLGRGLPVFDTDGSLTAFVRTSTDIDSQRKTETALRQSEKLAAVGKLASSISHEINNPLAAVTNLVYLLINNPSLDQTAREYLNSAQDELARIAEITTQALRFHKQSSAAVPVRIADVLDSVLAIYKPRIKSGGLQIHREYHGTPPLNCFAGEIRQVIANIIGNAIDATPQGGRLRVRLRSSTDWKTRQRLGVHITVGDTGHGVEEKNRKHIFEAFFTTKGINGTGLGLWISKDLIENHGGTISLRSSTGVGSSGTVISIFLPFEAIRPPQPVQPGNSGVILPSLRSS